MNCQDKSRVYTMYYFAIQWWGSILAPSQALYLKGTTNHYHIVQWDQSYREDGLAFQDSCMLGMGFIHSFVVQPPQCRHHNVISTMSPPQRRQPCPSGLWVMCKGEDILFDGQMMPRFSISLNFFLGLRQWKQAKIDGPLVPDIMLDFCDYVVPDIMLFL